VKLSESKSKVNTNSQRQFKGHRRKREEEGLYFTEEHAPVCCCCPLCLFLDPHSLPF